MSNSVSGANSQVLDQSNPNSAASTGVVVDLNPSTSAIATNSAEIVAAGTYHEVINAKAAGTLEFNGYGTGTLSTDSSGNVTASSDARLKDVLSPYERGLADLLKMDRPIIYDWKSELADIAAAKARLDADRAAVTGAKAALASADSPKAAAQAQMSLSRAEGQLAEDRRIANIGHPTYARWTAQGVEKGIPEAVGEGPDGFKTLSDRPIIAAEYNAILELTPRSIGWSEGWPS